VLATAGAVKPTTVSPSTAAQPSSLPLQEECPQCHAPRIPGVKFCNRCGYHFATLTSPAASSAMSLANTFKQTTQLIPGSILNGKYKIVIELGKGGMGAVYLADDLILKRRVVVKALLSEDDPTLVAQSVKEREFLADIKFANIVSIYDFITIGTQGYIVMEFVQGKTLDQIMEEQGHPFDVADAIKYILGILPAFSYLAKRDYVYCDFKPQNVMLENLKDGTQIVKLIDLGTVIKYVPKPDDVYGTHGFYAPEAVKTPSPETDLYSICRTLAYIITEMDLANPIFGMPPIESYRVFRDYPALYRLLVKGTHKNPAQRFHSAEELAEQLVGVQRLSIGGKPGVPVHSQLFVSSATTTIGNFGPRGEVALDENDKSIDLLVEGDLALRSANYSTALTLYRQAVSNNLSSVDGHLRLSEVFMERGELTQARAEVSTAQRIAPVSWKVMWYTGKLFEAQGDLVAASHKYRELISDLPGELPPLQALARICAKQNDDASAVSLYQDLLKADPGNTEAILGLTDSMYKLQHWNDAVRVLRSVSESSAKYVDAQLRLYDVYIKRMKPLTLQNIEHASQAIYALRGRTEDSRYYLAQGDVYRAAWQLARDGQLPATMTIAGVSDTSPHALGEAAAESYRQYLRREQHPEERETVVRHKQEVSPWRLF
jgi:serine/threonine-protein kinase PknG